MEKLTSLALLIGLALILDLLTGALGAPSIIATMVASRAMGPNKALLLSTLAELIGPFLFGLAVAKAVGSEVIDSHQITLPILYAALISAILWTASSWTFRIPSSASHAQIGSMLGASLVALNTTAIQGMGLLKVFISLILTAPLAVLGGYLMVRLCYWLAQGAAPSINGRFNQGQWIASFGLGLAIGTNSAQRTMGVISLGLLITGFTPHFEVPLWVVVISAVGLAFGNLVGGRRLLRTVGVKFFQVRPIHGFSAEAASAIIIAISSLLGGPVSTTHLTNLSIIGAGSAERLSMVRWGFVRHVLTAWILTAPVTIILGGLVYVCLTQLGLK